MASIGVPGASAEPRANDQAIMATGKHAATATRADGSTRVELPWLLPGDTGAAVSPDGRRVAFSSARGGSTEIYVADARAGIVGYTDRYPGFFHGQDIDITGLEPGLYVLVHRANPKSRIRELRYSNNAASSLIRISPNGAATGVPTVSIVRRCPTSDHCQAG